MRIKLCSLGSRRFLVRYFGGTKGFVVWILCVIVTVWFINDYITTGNPLTSNADSGSGDVSKRTSDERRYTAKKNSNDSDADRACAATCPQGQHSYFIRSGLKESGLPTICYDGHAYFSPDKTGIGGRGLNMLVINDQSGAVIERRTFDTYDDDYVYQRFVRLGMENHSIILIASANDASQHLSRESRKTLELFGSKVSGKLDFRDSLVMIGQKGLAPPAYAIEMHKVKTSSQDFADVSEISGCISFPMGSLVNVDSVISNLTLTRGDVQMGIEIPNCGMKEKCPDDTVPVWLFSGVGDSIRPIICYDGSQVIGSGNRVYSLGRGLNVLTVDPSSNSLVSFMSFDTYAWDKASVQLMEHVNASNPDHISLIVSNDDTSVSLTVEGIQALELLGSAYAGLLGFRDNWMIVGQRSMKGYAKLEKVSARGEERWPKPIDEKFCLPKKAPVVTKRESLPHIVSAPHKFLCQSLTSLKDLCNDKSATQSFTAAEISEASQKDNPIYKVPILVIPGSRHMSTYKQLSALFAVPGIKTEMITVIHDIKQKDPSVLADVFRVSKLAVNGSKYVDLVGIALEEMYRKHSQSDYFIILEEEVIPTKDFLHFLSQCLPVLAQDESLIGVSAWNENGNVSVSGRNDLVYRGRMMPGLGTLIKRSFYESHIKDKWSSCCRKSSWQGWFGDGGSGLIDKEMIYPDLSRVQVISADNTAEKSFSKGDMVALSNINSLSSVKKYDDELSELIRKSIKAEKSITCDDMKKFSFIPKDERSKSYVVYSDQSDESDETSLWVKAECFGLFARPGYKVRGIHESILRFTHEGNIVLIVGTKSKFYDDKS